MKFKLSGKLVVEELYSLPITNWYKLGLYLGIQENELQKIKEMDKTQLLKELFDDSSNDDQSETNEDDSALIDINEDDSALIDINEDDSALIDINEDDSAQSDKNEDDWADKIELPLLQQRLMLKRFVIVDEEKMVLGLLRVGLKESANSICKKKVCNFHHRTVELDLHAYLHDCDR